MKLKQNIQVFHMKFTMELRMKLHKKFIVSFRFNKKLHIETYILYLNYIIISLYEIPYAISYEIYLRMKFSCF